MSNRFTTPGLLAVLICFGLISACSTGWKPGKDNPAYKDSYQLTHDGSYRVRRGDTLHAIAFNFGMDWRDIAAWNSISAPYTIYPDQELRMSAPSTRTSKTVTTRPATAPSSTTVNNKAPASRSTTTVYKETPKPAASKTPAARDPAKWLWPAEGKIISNFKPNDPARKGIDIGGKEGQAVIATAGGEVVYSGSGLIGYGELIIIKHNERLLSAYAHNRKRLVKEGQKVSAGERIAEMGRNDRNQAMLHFEIRLNGNPQDPRKYLP